MVQDIKIIVARQQDRSTMVAIYYCLSLIYELQGDAESAISYLEEGFKLLRKSHACPLLYFMDKSLWCKTSPFFI